MNQHNAIDFIVLWVDSNDKNWQQKKARYSPNQKADTSAARYREWDNLRYWFRAVDKYAPWVRTVHFVTDHQMPVWLNPDCPKLHHINHEDYVPSDALPLFNSNAIEVGIHRIPGLADRFVLFNDDMFLTAPVSEDYYFHNGLPVDMAGLTRKCVPQPGKVFGNIMYNDYCVLNRFFSKDEIIKKNPWLWFNPCYGETFIRTLMNANRHEIDGLVIPHVSVPYVKSDFEKVWEQCGDELTATEHHRFREEGDINHFLFRFWRMCEGRFYPRKSSGQYIGISTERDVEKVCRIIRSQSRPELCINDTWVGDDYELPKQKIINAFESVLNEKSQFEL